MENYKTLREACEIAQVSRRAIHGYEEAGLVSASQKNKYGHLLYDAGAVQRISQIKLYQKFGYSIKEIQEIIDAPNEIRKEKLEKQLVKLKEDQKQLGTTIRVLQGIIDDLNEQLQMKKLD